jgi:hypothetical protein
MLEAGNGERGNWTSNGRPSWLVRINPIKSPLPWKPTYSKVVTTLFAKSGARDNSPGLDLELNYEVLEALLRTLLTCADRHFRELGSTDRVGC